MKLLQLNAWGGRLMDEISSLAQEVTPDIVCLQEVISTDLPMVFGTLEDFQSTLKYPHVHFSPTFHFEVMGEDAEFGNVILSNFPIVDSDTTFFSQEYARNFRFKTHDYNIRNFQLASLETPSGILHVLNFHGLQVPEHKNGNATTEKHCQLLVDSINQHDGAVVLAGDFNLAPTSPSLNPLNSLLTNHSVTAGLTSTRTKFSRKNEVCDYIFSSEEVQVLRFTQSDALVSDHSALVLEFDVGYET